MGMYKLCKTEQSARRQRQMELGLLDMMLQHRYEDISVSDLCDHLGIPRKSFYRYFSSKDGALYALLDHTMMEFFHATGSVKEFTPGSQLGDLDRYFAFWRKQEKLLDALQHNRLAGILVERAMNLALRERLMPGSIRTLSPELQQLAMSFSVCGLLSMVISWHNQKFRISPAEMTKIAMNMLTKQLIEI